MRENKVKEEKKGAPIYERLGPNECLIIDKTDKYLRVVCNKDGEVKLKRIRLKTEEE